MNRALGWAGGVLGLAAAFAQGTTNSQDSAGQERDVQELIEQLGSAKFQEREQAFDRLKEMQSAVRAELEAAADHADPEVRWRVAQLLDRLTEAESRSPKKLRLIPFEKGLDAPLGQRRLQDFRSWPELQQEMESLFEELETLHPEDMRGFFRGRPFHFRFFDDPFGIIDELVEKQGQEWSLAPGSRMQWTEVDQGTERTIKIQVDEQGRVSGEEWIGEDKRSFEYDSVEQFQEDRGEWFDKFAKPSPGRPMLRPAPLTPRLPPNLESTKASPPVLGIRVDGVHPVLADYLGLEPGTGLMIEEVMPGYPAEQIGLQSKDILVAMDGHPIVQVEDVRQRAAEKSPEQISYEVLRRGKTVRLGSR